MKVLYYELGQELSHVTVFKLPARQPFIASNYTLVPQTSRLKMYLLSETMSYPNGVLSNEHFDAGLETATQTGVRPNAITRQRTARSASSLCGDHLQLTYQ